MSNTASLALSQGLTPSTPTLATVYPISDSPVETIANAVFGNATCALSDRDSQLKLEMCSITTPTMPQVIDWKEFYKKFANKFDICASADKADHLAQAQQQTLIERCRNPFKNITALADSSTPLATPSAFRNIAIPNLNMVLQDADIRWLDQVDESIGHLQNWKLATGCVSETYFISNAKGEPIAVLKPLSEAGECVTNPALGSSLDGAYDYREAGIREQAAWIVGGKACSVPETHIIQIMRNGKLQSASLQRFVKSDGTLMDLASPTTKKMMVQAGIDPNKDPFALTLEENQKFAQTFMSTPEGLYAMSKMGKDDQWPLLERSTKDLQKIGLLDILIGNPDRHTKNMLTKTEGNDVSLTPIDHNLSFPEKPNLISLLTLPALSFPACLKPFDPSLIAFMKNLNIEETAQKLKKTGMSMERITTFRITAYVTKEAVLAGLNLLETTILVATDEFISKLLSKTFALRTDDSDEALFQALQKVTKETLLEKLDQIKQQGASDSAVALSEHLQEETYRDLATFSISFQRLVGALQGRPPECIDSRKDQHVLYDAEGACPYSNQTMVAG